MSSVKIRRAKGGDEPSIARVHIQSWQEAYQGIIPSDYLDSLSANLSERITVWEKILANPQRWAFVAEAESGIVGFVLFGTPRDGGKISFIELGAIYLLAAEKSKGIGFSLLSAGFKLMKELGYNQAYCWVLQGNPTIAFYEKTGAKFTGEIKEDEIGGAIYNEMAYQWESLDFGT